MLTYLIRRLLWLVPVLGVISAVTFFLMHSVPGNPFDQEDKPLPPEVIARLEAHYHLDEPVWRQYLRYMGGALRGDLGPSYLSKDRSVNDIIARHFPVSFVLGTLSLGVAVVIGIPLGIVSALRQNTVADYVSMFMAVSGVSVPALTLGPLLMWGLALQLGLLPVARWGSWQQAVMPAFTLGIGQAAILARLTRASMLQVIREDYVRTARAKGVSERRVIVHHALRNALPPITVICGLQLGYLLGGALFTEVIFAWPGIGNQLYYAIIARDIPTVQASVLLIALLFVLVNLAVDILNAYMDPKIRVSEERKRR